MLPVPTPRAVARGDGGGAIAVLLPVVAAVVVPVFCHPHGPRPPSLSVAPMLTAMGTGAGSSVVGVGGLVSSCPRPHPPRRPRSGSSVVPVVIVLVLVPVVIVIFVVIPSSSFVVVVVVLRCCPWSPRQYHVVVIVILVLV
jgi:hypothetical protein